MDFIADLHIHSHYSVATSKLLTPEYLDYWARLKGIKVVGTGDFTHPGWLAEMKEKLEPTGQGLYRLKEDFRIPSFRNDKKDSTQFLLTAEISNIYKKKGSVRKIHNIVFAPDFETVERFQNELQNRKFNITSDGRPILGMDAKNLLELTLETSSEMFFIPAHIWTPWFSTLGSKSGFNSIEECFEELTEHIYALETGLSTDPAMNWMCSILDRFNLISNSDAHSPEKLGRNANLFNTELSYKGITDALKHPGKNLFSGTFDMFPQEGKYHYDGHRKCGVRWSPLDTLKHGGICPECGKKVTVGVTHRVAELSDRSNLEERPNRKAFYSIIPLKELLSEIEKAGENSKRVKESYLQHIQKAGSEFNLLHFHPIEQIEKENGKVLAEAIRRMRKHEVMIEEGYDGRYGKVKVFRPGEQSLYGSDEALFSNRFKLEAIPQRKLINFNVGAYQHLKKHSGNMDAAAEVEAIYKTSSEDSLLSGLNAGQENAVKFKEGQALILAGPGTGKTGVLTRRIAYLIQNQNIPKQKILAVTFTNQAAGEMEERVSRLLHQPVKDLFIGTFHRLGYTILKETQDDHTDLQIINEDDKKFIFSRLAPDKKQQIKKYIREISWFKQGGAELDDACKEVFELYSNYLQTHALVDLDDLLYKTVGTLKNDRQVLKKYQRRWEWALIDEFQDINPIQYEVIQLLFPGETPNLFAIGDNNQSIYSFRGAKAEQIESFKSDYPELQIMQLSTSYRCTDIILKASGNILQKNDILEGLEEGVKIAISAQPTDKSEAEFIAREIERLSGGLRFFSMDSDITRGEKHESIESLSDFAILCRTKAQIPVLEKALNDHSIPHQSIYEEKFHQHPLVIELLDILRTIREPDNQYFIDKIRERYKIPLISFNKYLKMDWNNPLVLVKSIWGTITSSDEKEEANHILEQVLHLIKQNNLNSEELIEMLSLGKAEDFGEFNSEKVKLMTLHAAKGLEFTCVFITGCEQGLIPYTLYHKNNNKEEENRLLYVAMTRAKQLLYLTHASKRFHRGRSLELPKSQFLHKIEKQLLQRIQHEYQKKGKKQDQLKLF